MKLIANFRDIRTLQINTISEQYSTIDNLKNHIELIKELCSEKLKKYRAQNEDTTHLSDLSLLFSDDQSLQDSSHEINEAENPQLHEYLDGTEGLDFLFDVADKFKTIIDFQKKKIFILDGTISELRRQIPMLEEFLVLLQELEAKEHPKTTIEFGEVTAFSACILADKFL